MDCRCNDATEFYGEEAERYAADHLVADESRDEPLEERYSCPDTGRRWPLDYPDRTDGDPGPARLAVA